MILSLSLSKFNLHPIYPRKPYRYSSVGVRLGSHLLYGRALGCNNIYCSSRYRRWWYFDLANGRTCYHDLFPQSSFQPFGMYASNRSHTISAKEIPRRQEGLKYLRRFFRHLIAHRACSGDCALKGFVFIISQRICRIITIDSINGYLNFLTKRFILSTRLRR